MRLTEVISSTVTKVTPVPEATRPFVVENFRTGQKWDFPTLYAAFTFQESLILMDPTLDGMVAVWDPSR